MAANHQYKNAKALADAGAATLVEESEFSEGRFTAAVRELLASDTRRCEQQSKIAFFARFFELAENFAPRTNRAIIDLKSVSFMDSTGIGFLIGRYKKFFKYGIPMYVTNLSSSTEKV